MVMSKIFFTPQEGIENVWCEGADLRDTVMHGLIQLG